MTYSDKDFARYTRSYWNKHQEEHTSIVQEHIERIEQGVDAWNAFDKAFAEYLKNNKIDDGLYCFSEAQFSSHANFGKAQFSGIANFGKAQFSSQANFSEAQFSNEALFYSTIFESLFHFSNAKAKMTVPYFSGVQYKIAPMIEGFSVPFNKGQDFERNIELYRQLKKMAIDGANHEQEVRFFGFETRCKIYLKNTPKPTKVLIWLYYSLSDFGQSIMRPLLGILLCWVMATAATILTVMPSPLVVSLYNDYCETPKANQTIHLKFEAAIRQSSHFILPFLPTDRETKREINRCLYGGNGTIPWVNGIINSFQQLLMLVFLFLLGLAIRNRFKIK